MIRKLTIQQPTTKQKLLVLNALQSRYLSDIELAVLAEIVDFSSSGTITLTVAITKQIRGVLGIGTSAFNTAVFRLSEKNAIKKEGKTIVLNPLFNNINDLSGVLISFNQDSPLPKD